MTTFVLVHGAWHGPWCWERLTPELEAHGHGALTPALPVSDGTATFVRYADLVDAALEEAGPDAIVVGHSLGAMVLPLLTRPAARHIYLCGVIPRIGGFPWEGAPDFGRPGAYDCEAGTDGSTTYTSLEAATFAFYDDCDPGDAAWAFEHLVSQNSTSLWNRPYPAQSLPDVPRTAVAAVDDHAITIEFSRAVIEPRLGVRPIEIPGGHSPFLARPAYLADLLTSLI